MYRTGPLAPIVQLPIQQAPGNNGFTTFTPTLTLSLAAQQALGATYSGTGTRFIYVAAPGSGGNDSTGNGSQATPYATIGKGSSFIRDGFPDWLLLNQGDVFQNDNFGSFGGFSGPGAVITPAFTAYGDHTASGMIVCTTYGTGARPSIQSSVTFVGAGGSIIFLENTNHISNVAIVGWDFYAYTRDPNNGSFSAGDTTLEIDGIFNNNNNVGSNFLLEDCLFRFFWDSVIWEPLDFNGFWIRKCIFLDNYNANSHNNDQGGETQGVFLANIENNWVIDDCTFDHNGWNAGITGAIMCNLNHNIYIAVVGTGPGYLRNNIISRPASSEQLRPGGTIYDNLFIQTAAGLNIGIGPSTISYNVIQETTDITGALAELHGEGIINNGGAPSTIDHNIISNAISTNTTGFGIQIQDGNTGNGYQVTGNFTIGQNTITNVDNSNNNYNNLGWPNGMIISCPARLPGNGTATVTGASGFTAAGGNGTLTISVNATSSGTATTFNTLTESTVTNNIVYNQVAGAIATTNGTTSTASAVLHFASVPSFIQTNAGNGYTVIDATTNKFLGHIASATSTTVTLQANSLAAVGNGDKISFGGIDNGATGVTFTGNSLDPAGINSGQPGEPFPAPTRSVESYNVSIGGLNSLTDFLGNVRNRGRGVWQVQYSANTVNNYIRGGFNFPQL
jgi:hypothetical protein